jgi:long-chain acyl-CoA synthetase
MLVHQFLENSAKKFAYKTAVINEDQRTTFSVINEDSNNIAAFFISHGIAKGDRVVLLFENSIEYIIAYYSVLKAGAVAVPYSTGLKPDSLRSLLEDTDPAAIISSKKYERLLKASDLECCSVKFIILKNYKNNWDLPGVEIYSWGKVIHHQGVSKPSISVSESDLACIIYTSGSTGTPKGVMLSHKNIVSNTISICTYLKLSERDIQMVVLPFFYVMGKSLLNTHFAVGGTIVINNKFAFPATVVKQLADEKVTGFSGVPSTYAYLLHRSPLKKYKDKLPALRYCSQAGGHMSKRLKQDLRKALPDHTQIFIMYGATEASARLSYLEPEMFNEKIESIGRSIPDVELNILDNQGYEVDHGQTGELVASGSNIMQGYWKDDRSTKKALGRHGYHTGDMAYQDADGYFYLNGRKDSLIKVGGHRINPQEVEDAIMETGLVIEAAVVSIPDDLLGSKLIALATPADLDTTENQILSDCSDKLPKYKVPSELIFIRALPKNTSGKIDRIKCVEIANKL